MSNYNWCHGPECHEKSTLDRIRGSKGNKVLRTKRIRVDTEYIRNSVWSHFCSQGCWNDFMYAHWDEFIRLHPRTEPLETPIEVDVVTRTLWNGQTYKTKDIKEVVDNA